MFCGEDSAAFILGRRGSKGWLATSTTFLRSERERTRQEEGFGGWVVFVCVTAQYPATGLTSFLPAVSFFSSFPLPLSSFLVIVGAVVVYFWFLSSSSSSFPAVSHDPFYVSFRQARHRGAVWHCFSSLGCRAPPTRDLILPLWFRTSFLALNIFTRPPLLFSPAAPFHGHVFITARGNGWWNVPPKRDPAPTSSLR